MEGLLFIGLVLLGVAALVGGVAFALARRAAAEGTGGRSAGRALVVLAVVALAGGWLWSKRPLDTPGSAAGMMMQLARIGGALVLILVGAAALGTLAGALWRRPSGS